MKTIQSMSRHYGVILKLEIFSHLLNRSFGFLSVLVTSPSSFLMPHRDKEKQINIAMLRSFFVATRKGKKKKKNPDKILHNKVFYDDIQQQLLLLG